MTRFGRAASAAIIVLAGATHALAGSVSGLVTNESGEPLSGIHVEIVNQTFRMEDLGYSIKAETVTDANGHYTVSTDRLTPGEYYAHAYEIVSNSGRDMNVDLMAHDERSFVPHAVTVRNFTAGVVEFSEEMPYGNAGVFVLNNAIMDFTDLAAAEVTLVEVATGRSFVKAVRSTGEGLVVTGIPFGTYSASVSLDGRPMLVSLWGPGLPDSFGQSVVHDFTMGYAGNQFQVAVKPAQ